jgi:hypothetical protein
MICVSGMDLKTAVKNYFFMNVELTSSDEQQLPMNGGNRIAIVATHSRCQYLGFRLLRLKAKR